ncbi:MAG: molybdopterin-dependent oxidoreductase [Thermomicrobiales bacterium]|nr:molybdopterin-dependent oxidoreductase [Thermomicrobiales bacterium]
MTATPLSRRSLIQSSAAVVAGHQLLRLAGPAHAFPALQEGEVIPWIDQPEPNPVPDVIVRQLDWEALADWQTPNDDFFVIKHFNLPEIDLATWQLHVEGLVDTPLALTLEDLQARPAQDLPFTIECSGNTGLPFFDGGIGNAVWTGTPLAPLLEEANVQDAGTEVVFWGADSGDQVWNDKTITEHFARSLSLEEAMHPEVLLA